MKRTIILILLLFSYPAILHAQCQKPAHPRGYLVRCCDRYDIIRNACTGGGTGCDPFSGGLICPACFLANAGSCLASSATLADDRSVFSRRASLAETCSKTVGTEALERWLSSKQRERASVYRAAF